MGTGYESTHGEDDLEKRQIRTANALQEFMALGRNNPVYISTVKSQIADTLNTSSRIEKTEPSKEAIAAARGFLFNLQKLRPYIAYIHRQSGKRQYEPWFENTNSQLYPLVTNENPEEQLRHFLRFSMKEIENIRRYLGAMAQHITIHSLHFPYLDDAREHINRILSKIS